MRRDRHRRRRREPERVRPNRLVGMSAGLTAILTALVAAPGGLPGPTIALSRTVPLGWSPATTPPSLVMGLVRTGAAAATAYLLLATLVELVACASRSGAGAGPCDRWWHRLPWATDVVRRMAGAGLAASLVGASIAPRPVGADGPRRPPVMRMVTSGTAPPVMRVVGLPTPTPAATRALPARTRLIWTIRPGDHLWRVSSETLQRTWGRRAPDPAIADYLDAIIAANVHVFVVPGDADLVYPGQQFVLPAPPTP
jgi:hypothetical protein